ncbi:MAG: pimeloyl-ACP methyl ester carboxylesterase [Bermanella sp.]|jgi:pimeloyl-ACP methyl ester carboxylesterase
MAVSLYGCTAMGTASVPYSELAKKYTNESSQYMDINGLTVHYRVEGEGPPLLLLHGVSSSLHTWDAWVDQLKDNYQVIRLDMPGFGLTGPDVDPSSHSEKADYMVNVLNTFTEKLGLQRFFLVGNSLGGYYAWNYAAKYPLKVYKMILMSATGYPQDMPFWLGLASFPVINWISPHMMPRYLVNKTIYSAYENEDLVTDEVKERYFDMLQRRGNRQSYVRHFVNMRHMTDDTVGEQLQDVVVPTLLMWGAEDKWIPLHVMRNFHRDLPYSDYLVYEGVGHLPMEEVPVQSARDANNFFMAELRKPSEHTQESEIKFYDTKKYDFNMGSNEIE